MVTYLIKHKAKYQSQADSFLKPTSMLARVLSTDNLSRLQKAFRPSATPKPSASSGSAYSWNLLTPKRPARTNHADSTQTRPLLGVKAKQE